MLNQNEIFLVYMIPHSLKAIKSIYKPVGNFEKVWGVAIISDKLYNNIH